MFVNPQGIVHIMHGIQWRSDGKNVRLFDTESDLVTYMTTHQKFKVENFTYIREQKVLRVPIKADELYDCNYMSFLNKGFGLKVFYAFINDVKWVNDETSEISFEIDDFQTWFYNLTLGTCFVEREHVNDDTIGLNTVQEGLNFGDLCVHTVYNRYWSEKDANDNYNWKLALQIKPSMIINVLGRDWKPVYYGNNQFYPCTFEDTPDNVDSLSLWIQGMFTSGCELTSAYMFPKEFGETIAPIPLDTELRTNGIQRPSSFIHYEQDKAVPDEYEPKNNKLLTFPYTKLIVCSTDGNQAEFQWERTKEGFVSFSLYHNHLNTPSCQLRPLNYFRNASQRMQSICLDEFPRVNLSAYSSLNLGNMFNIASYMGKMRQSGHFDTTPDPEKHAKIKEAGDKQYRNELSSVGGNIVSQIATDSGTTLSGTTDSCLDIKYNSFGFQFYVMAIDAVHAKTIDDYFTRYGYKINQVKVPIIRGRRYFNFVKTKECMLTGNAPDDAINNISAMFDSGITLWHTNEIGGEYDDNYILPG